MLLCLVFLVVASYAVKQNPILRFANTYGDHMVLQAAPKHAIVWGFCGANESVIVQVDEMVNVTATITPPFNSSYATIWQAVLLPVTASFKSHVIKVTSTSEAGVVTSVSLNDVLFGSVWVCSGQSNMRFTVSQAYNASEEIQRANAYPHVRLFSVNSYSSPTPLIELDSVLQNWSIASNTTVGGPKFQYFSAVCWFFGRDLADYLNHPVGLIASSVGGTVIEKWMGPAAFESCGIHYPKGGQLWNGMIVPLTKTVVEGILWYQGESNQGNAVKYNCSFPALIADWRAVWRNATSGQTGDELAFGFVQLSTKSDATNETVGGYGLPLFAVGYAGIRWAQTASFGFTPNPVMPGVFMAAAVDLGQAHSPSKGPHVQDKQDVGKRLLLAARETVFGEQGLHTPGPIATHATRDGNGHVTVFFKNLSPAGFQLPLPTSIGFEVSSGNDTWVNVTHVIATKSSVTLTTVSSLIHAFATKVRYLWAYTPCLPVVGLECPLHDSGPNRLPGLPFVLDVIFEDDTN